MCDDENTVCRCVTHHEFSELVRPENFFHAHGLGVVLDDILSQEKLESWMADRTAMGWPNDGGGRRKENG